MSQKANFDSDTFSEAYARVLKATGCACQKELAKKLGVRQSFITDCCRRGEFTSEILLALVERCGLNPRWVRTGEGEKYLVNATKAEQQLSDIMFLCTETDGTRGIWKRIDETREMFECIQQLGPEFLQRCPWVEGWLSYQYSFLNSLRILLDIPNHMEGFDNFPRPFPASRCDWEATCGELVESSRSKIPTWLREQAKGND